MNFNTEIFINNLTLQESNINKLKELILTTKDTGSIDYIKSVQNIVEDICNGLHDLTNAIKNESNEYQSLSETLLDNLYDKLECDIDIYLFDKEKDFLALVTDIDDNNLILYSNGAHYTLPISNIYKYKILDEHSLKETCSSFILKNPVGISMVKEVRENAITVKVLDTCNELITSYSYINSELKYSSPYLSWENLGFCGGWAYSEEELINSVKEGKKLFADVFITKCSNDAEKLLSLVDSYYSIPDVQVVKHHTENDRRMEFTIVKKGCVSDYLDLDKVLDCYYDLGLPKLDEEEYTQLCNLCNTPMSEFATRHNKFNYDFANPSDDIEFMFTGLLLGYPIESTVDRMGI